MYEALGLPLEAYASYRAAAERRPTPESLERLGVVQRALGVTRLPTAPAP